MTDSCCCPSEAGNSVCELPLQNHHRQSRAIKICPVCGVMGKPIQKQTVQSLLMVSLREIQDIEYLFCKTRDCPIVYFSQDGEQTFRIEHIRERVFQKEPESDDVFVCYCFRYTLGDIHAASPESNRAILDNINIGINAGQCACDLRNPQGSCCLGNVRGLMNNVESNAIV